MHHLIPLLVLLLVPAAAVGAVQHPLSVAPDGRSLLDATDRDVAFHAATPWHLLTRLTREETLEYLDARAGQGFDSLLFSLLVSDGYAVPSVANAYGEEPFLSPGDFTRPNEAYFEHVDWVLEQMRQRGMTAFLVPVYLGYQCGEEGWCPEVQAAGAAVMRDFGRALATRWLSQPNLVYVHGGDVDAADYGLLDETDALVEGMIEVDPDRLHTAHCSRYNSASDCYDRPWLDVETTYADCDLTARALRDDYLATDTRPMLYLEGRYEFERDWTTQCIRAQAWWAALGGARAHFYGSARIWDFTADWRNGLSTPGTESMRIFGELLRARGWADLRPDYTHAFLVAGYGDVDGADYAAAALRSDGRTGLVYVPTQRVLTVDLGGLQAEEIEAWWFDPSTGEATLEGIHAASGTRQFSPPDGNDWVLVLDDLAAALPDPWATSTAAAPSAPSRVELGSVAPNPFNPVTTISFRAEAGADVEVAVFDARGRHVSTLFAGTATGTDQRVVWRADELASGTYFVRARSSGHVDVVKTALVE